MIRDRTLKALSLLLCYPTAEWREAMPEIAALLAAETRLGERTRRGLESLSATLAHGDLYDVQETYVALFDRSRALSLNLFEHLHGESRDRGGAMVDLLDLYRAGGFEPSGWELPDHLPRLLEFLSTRPPAEARDILADAASLIEALGTRLERRGSPYAAVFAALIEIAGPAGDRASVSELLAAPDIDPDDFAALDAAWEESEVTFGPDSGAGCPAGSNPATH